ncbi:RnfH family protein [Caenimonas koreensis]|uniref:RnfH family protein n=1 Tax=Caenimonas koreensis TaxID=367474 RepID=UPI0037847FAC
MAERVRIQVIWSPQPRHVLEWKGDMEAGATVLEALRASGLLSGTALLEPVGVGIWGRKCRLDREVRDGDRVEAYRPLTVDPKVARRERFRKQGARAAGLFAQRRVGAKAGY